MIFAVRISTPKSCPIVPLDDYCYTTLVLIIHIWNFKHRIDLEIITPTGIYSSLNTKLDNISSSNHWAVRQFSIKTKTSKTHMCSAKKYFFSII